jgi:hypothetical protein
MSLAQYLIPAAVAVLLAYQGALTHTSRLRRHIKADIDLLADLPDALPPDHPSRVELTGAIGEQTKTLARRRRGQLQAMVPGGVSFGVNVALAVVLAGAVTIGVLEATGLSHSEPLTREEWWQALAFYAALMVGFAGLALRAWRRARSAPPLGVQGRHPIAVVFGPRLGSTRTEAASK